MLIKNINYAAVWPPLSTYVPIISRKEKEKNRFLHQF